MNHSSNSHSRIFLMELIIAVLFFSLASAVCLRMFAASRQISKDAVKQNMAMTQAGNAAELLKYAHSQNENFPACILEQYPYAVTDTAEITVYFDEDWIHCAIENAVFLLQIVQVPTEDDIIPYQIAVWDTTDNNAAIYTLDLKLHTPFQP